MGNANIDEELKKEIKELLLNDVRYRAKYQHLKGFIDNACLDLLDKIKKNEKK